MTIKNKYKLLLCAIQNSMAVLKHNAPARDCSGKPEARRHFARGRTCNGKPGPEACVLALCASGGRLFI